MHVMLTYIACKWILDLMYIIVTLYMYAVRILDYMILVKIFSSPSVFICFCMFAYLDSVFDPGFIDSSPVSVKRI